MYRGGLVGSDTMTSADIDAPLRLMSTSTAGPGEHNFHAGVSKFIESRRSTRMLARDESNVGPSSVPRMKPNHYYRLMAGGCALEDVLLIIRYTSESQAYHLHQQRGSGSLGQGHKW